MYDNMTRTGLEFAHREAEKRIEQLEKENEELKEEMEAKQVVLNDFKSRVETVTERFNKKSSQFTKAKEIISELLSWESRADYDYAEYDLIKDKAEQFLKDCSK